MPAEPVQFGRIMGSIEKQGYSGRKLKVFLTVDVECYSGDYEREVYGSGLGLEYILRVLQASGAKATFFVEALGATRWGMRPLQEMSARIGEAGQDLQLHVHPAIARLADYRDTSDVLHLHDTDMQERLLETGLRILTSCGRTIVAFRAGDMAANEATLEAMRRVGILKGSNRDLDTKRSTRSLLNEVFPVKNDVCEHGGIIDVPVSCFRSPLPIFDGRYRHLEICAVGILELKSCLCKMAGAGYSTACIFTHPREFFAWRNGRATPVVKNCRRLEWLVNYVEAGSFLEWSTMADCDPKLVAKQSRPEITLSCAWTLLRMIQQVVG